MWWERDLLVYERDVWRDVRRIDLQCDVQWGQLRADLRRQLRLYEQHTRMVDLTLLAALIRDITRRVSADEAARAECSYGP